MRSVCTLQGRMIVAISVWRVLMADVQGVVLNKSDKYDGQALLSTL